MEAKWGVRPLVLLGGFISRLITRMAGVITRHLGMTNTCKRLLILS